MRTTTRSAKAKRRGGLAPLLAAALGMCMLAGGLLWALGDMGVRRVGGPFALVDTAGRPVTERDFRGRYMLLYFGYTSCPDVCPVTLHEMALALDRLGARGAQVQPVFVTVDPGRDTPSVLRAYAEAIDPHLVALTGSDAAVAAALRSFHVQRDIRHMSGGAGYLVDHSSVLLLIGPDGRLVAPVRADEPAERMAHDIAAHLS